MANKTTRKVLVFIMLKIQMFCVGLSVFLSVYHFNLMKEHILYYPLGTFSILLIMLSLTPLPSFREQAYIDSVATQSESRKA